MKRDICIFFLLIVYPITEAELFAQQKKQHSFSPGYGYKTDTKWWREAFETIPANDAGKSSGTILNYQFDYKKNIQLGAELLYNEEFKDKTLFSNSFGDYSYESYSVRLLPYISYNLIKTKRFSFYTGIAAGFYFLRVKAFHHYTTPTYFQDPIDEMIVNKKNIGFDWAAATGAKFSFNKNIGVFSEIGLHKSVFQVGIVFQTGK